MNICKILYDTLYIKDNVIDPIYSPKTGIIVDSKTGQVILELSTNELSKFLLLDSNLIRTSMINFTIPIQIILIKM